MDERLSISNARLRGPAPERPKLAVPILRQPGNRGFHVSTLIIAGFHRSGTSLLAQVFDRAGLFLGDNLLGANPHNPKGHYEDLDVLRLHDLVLKNGGRTWQVTADFIPTIPASVWRKAEKLIDHRNRHHQQWGFKDPRVCLTVPMWKHLIPDAKILMTWRDPASSAFSLEMRHSRNLLENRGPRERHWRFWMDDDHSLKMWATYHRGLLRAAEAYKDDFMVVSFDDLARNADVVGMVTERFGFDLMPVLPFSVYDPGLVSPPPGDISTSDDRVRAEIESLRERLESLQATTSTQVMS